MALATLAMASLLSGPAYALRVVTTVPDLAALARAIGGAHVTVTALAPPNQDPHFVDPRPSLMLPLSRADLLIAVGLQLEQGWLPQLIRGARNPRILPGQPGHVVASSFVRLLQVPRGGVNRAMGDVHPGGNPHFYHDPRAAAQIARGIGMRLAQLDPVHKQAYAIGSAALIKRLLRLANAQRARFAKLSAAQRGLVSYHRSLAYLYDWLGLHEVATVEPKPGIPPSPAHTARVLTTMRRTGARVIAQEAYYPRRVSQTLAKLVGGRVVVLPGGARFTAKETYEARIRRTADALYEALSKFTPKPGR